MSDKPTIYVTNWSSTNKHGPGPKYTIMAKPRYWEVGDGFLDALTPSLDNFEALQAGLMGSEEYRSRYLSRLDSQGGSLALAPGRLSTRYRAVEGGSTLCCACSVKRANRGLCHRVWAAQALERAGWEVVLDGKGIYEDEPKQLSLLGD